VRGVDVRASDVERDATIERLREAAAQGRLSLEELTDRIEAASKAQMRSELVRVVADLPATTAVGQVVQAPSARAVGDIKRSGAWAVPAENHFRTWWGNVTLDLREAELGAGETRIHARVGFGNVNLLVPKGVEVELRAGTQIGRTVQQLEPATLGAPRVILTGGTFFGDVKVRHRSVWDKVPRRRKLGR
jgi:hypothetical protein